MHDLRYALRALGKQPLFMLVAVLTLTLGIGANTAIFSLLYHVLLRPLPYPDADRLVFLWNAYKKDGLDVADVSIPDYLDRRGGMRAIEDATLVTLRRASLSVSGQVEEVSALAVTPSFFSTFGRAPQLGRAFTESDATTGADRFVILTHAFWSSRFARDPAIVGRTIRLNASDHLVLGVLSRDFELPWRDAAVLVPFSFTAAQRSDQARGNEFSEMVGRLRAGATIEQANAQMDAIVAQLMERVPARAAYMRNSGFTGVAQPLRERLIGDTRTSLYLLQAGVLLVLVIACANVANLLLMRSSARHRELAIRASLGAGHWRIARQLLTEGALLSALGGAAGVLLGAAGLRTLTATAAAQIPEIADAGVRPAVLFFTLVLAIATAIIFGLVPAFAIMRTSAASALKDDSVRGSAGRGATRIRATLVIVETAMAVVLLVGAGLLLKSFLQVVRVDPGFAPARVLTAQLSLPPPRYPNADTRRAFWARALEDAQRIPGVTAAGVTSNVPFSGMANSGTYTIVGRPLAATERLPHASQDFVAGEYFRAMGIPLLDGRLFNEGDTATSPRVVIVDEFFANRQFKGDRAVGHQVNFGSTRNYTIIGVVGTVSGTDLAKPVPEERIYLHAMQLPQNGMALVARTDLPASDLAPQLRAIVQRVDPEQPIANIRTMQEWIGRSLQPRRTPMVLLAIFGAVALILAAIGIYGVVAFGVTERVREFGIRQALGADRRAILSLVFVQGLWRAAAGVAIGIGLSLAATRLLQSVLFGVAPHDAAVFAIVAVTLLTVAALACYLPAHRATTVDPIVALREG